MGDDVVDGAACRRRMQQLAGVRTESSASHIESKNGSFKQNLKSHARIEKIIYSVEHLEHRVEMKNELTV